MVNKMTRTSIFFSIALSLLLSACAHNPDSYPDKQTAAETKTVIYLVRHAEKVLDVKNPPLTAAGKFRAEQLALRLSTAKLKGIYSTDYIRTMETATPVAAIFKLPIQSYDPRALDSFSQELKAQSGNYLVVGHSNTTPDLVRELGGNPGSAINEQSEYDRLYRLSIMSNGETKTELMRFGLPYKKAQ